MIQIKKPVENIVNILGKQSINNKAVYRLSHFCLELQVNNGYLIFNNLTKEILLFTNREFSELKDRGCLSSEEENINLVEHWFIVPQEFDEIAICQQLRQVLRLLKPQKEYINNFTILPTTGCNARCFYCYEAGASVKTMGEKTAIDVAEYILKKSACNKVRLNWFGGEPLCNINAIDCICNYLKQHNVDYYSTMTSNAYNFDEEIVKKAVGFWKLKWIQITLDGLEDTYNRVKNYKNHDSNAFSRVIKNIDYLCSNNVQVQIRMNLDKHNENELFQLAEFLHTKFGKYKNFIIYVIPIYEDVGFEKTVRSDEERSRITDQCISLYNHFDDLGFKYSKKLLDEISIYSCQADKKDWVMIMPDGHLGCCEHYVDSDSFGTIYDDSPKPHWSNFCNPIEECKKCPAYPTCLILEKCPAASPVCNEYRRFKSIHMLLSGMRDAYNSYLGDMGNMGDRDTGDGSLC